VLFGNCDGAALRRSGPLCLSEAGVFLFPVAAALFGIDGGTVSHSGDPIRPEALSFQGIVLLFLPSATIAWMIYATEGAASPYYAGLTLVLMVLAVVLDWTFCKAWSRFCWS
jgi:hypothetical protein